MDTNLLRLGCNGVLTLGNAMFGSVFSPAASTGDPDADGHANLLEYAVGNDPWDRSDRSDQTDLNDHLTTGQPYTHTDNITPGARRILHPAPAAFCTRRPPHFAPGARRILRLRVAIP